MHQRTAIQEAWRKAGLYDSADPKLKTFLEMLDDPRQCWPELVAASRGVYADIKAKLVGPILETGDKLMRLNLIRAADPNRADEVGLLSEFIKTSDPQRDEIELQEIARKSTPQLLSDLKQKPGLTLRVSEVVDRLTAEQAAASRPAEAAPRESGGPTGAATA
jgi:hypothetical protein